MVGYICVLDQFEAINTSGVNFRIQTQFLEGNKSQFSCQICQFYEFSCSASTIESIYEHSAAEAQSTTSYCANIGTGSNCDQSSCREVPPTRAPAQGMIEIQ